MRDIHPLIYIIMAILGASLCFNLLLSKENHELRKKLLEVPVPIIIDKSIIKDLQPPIQIVPKNEDEELQI